MPKSEQLKRQWSLLRTLASRTLGATVREMSEEWDVDQRTIRRDLVDLQAIGFPLTETISDHGRKHWKLSDLSSSIPLQFSWEEAAALFLARRMLDPFAGTIWWDSAQSAFRKFRAMLSEPALRYLDKMAAVFYQTSFGTADYSRHADIIDRLMQAVEDRKITAITYQSLRSTEPVTVQIYPLGICWHRNALYCVAHAVEPNEIRHYRVDRISEIDVLNLVFNKFPKFNLVDHFADSFGIFNTQNSCPVQVRVRFDRAAARSVSEKTWHSSQKLVPQRDGSLIAEFQLADPFTEFLSWILSFGGSAKVLEPPSLAQLVREEVAKLAAAYGPLPRMDEEETQQTRH